MPPMAFALATALSLISGSLAQTELRLLVLADYGSSMTPFNRMGFNMLEYPLVGIEFGAHKFRAMMNNSGNNVSVKIRVADVGQMKHVAQNVLKEIEDFQPCWIEGVFHGDTEKNLLAAMVASGQNVVFNTIKDLSSLTLMDAEKYTTAMGMMPSNLFYFTDFFFRTVKVEGWRRAALLYPTQALGAITLYDEVASNMGLDVRFVPVDTSVPDLVEAEIERALQTLRNEKYSIIGCSVPTLNDPAVKEFFYRRAIELNLTVNAQWYFGFADSPVQFITNPTDPIGNAFFQSRDFETHPHGRSFDPTKQKVDMSLSGPAYFQARVTVKEMQEDFPFDMDIKGRNCSETDFLCKAPGIPQGYFPEFIAYTWMTMMSRSSAYLRLMLKAEEAGLCGAAVRNNPEVPGKLKDLFANQSFSDDPLLQDISFDYKSAGGEIKNIRRSMNYGVKLLGQPYPAYIIATNLGATNNDQEVAYLNAVGEYFQYDWILDMPVVNATRLLHNRSHLLWMGNSSKKPGDVLIDVCDFPQKHIVNLTTAECQPCPRGMGNPLDGSNLCSIDLPEVCPAGSAWSFERKSCELCKKGTFADKDGSTVCTPCAAGSYASKTGSLQCADCPPGNIAPQDGMESCQACDRGSYTEGSDRTVCLPCSKDRTTAEVSSYSAADCRCFEGMLRLLNDQCEPCNDLAMDCPGVSFDGNITSKTGFMMIPLQTDLQSNLYTQMPRAYRCMSDAACPGNLWPGECPQGHEGIACAECSSSYSMVEGKCMPCADGDAGPTLYVLGVMATFLVVCAGLLFLSRKPMNVHATQGFAVTNTAALFVSFLQIYSVAGKIGNLEWPVTLTWIFAYVCSPLSMEPDGSSIQCAFGSLGNSGFMLQKFVLLLAAYGVIALIWQVWKFAAKTTPITFNHFCNTLGAVSNLAFIPLSMQALSMLYCYPHPDSRGLSMVSLPAVLCFEEKWTAEILWAGLLGLLFSIALLVLFALAAQRAPRMRDLSGVQFLVARFKPSTYFWGVGLLVRNLLLAASPIVSASPFIVLTLMSVVLLVYLAALCRCWPWKVRWHNIMDVACTMTLLLTMLIGASFSPARISKDSVEWTIMSVLVSLAIFGVLGCFCTALTLGTLRVKRQKEERPAQLAGLLEDLTAVSQEFSALIKAEAGNAELMDALNQNLRVLSDGNVQCLSESVKIIRPLVLGTEKSQQCEIILVEAVDVTKKQPETETVTM